VTATEQTAGAAGQEPSTSGDVNVDADAPDTTDERPRRDRTKIALAASAAALVLLLLGALLLGLQLRSAAQDDAARSDALSAARQSALNLTSIDQEDFEGDVAAVIDGATGEFRTDFAARAGDLERLLVDNDVAAEGQVLESGLVRADRNTATALVVVDSTVRNTATPDGRVNSYRMKLQLERVGDRWLTSVLEFVG
jgi:Mce-associated membrane protein